MRNWLGLAVLGTMLATGVGCGGGEEQGVDDLTAAPDRSLEVLASLGDDELERIYAAGKVADVPEGDSRGVAIALERAPFTGLLNKVANFVWSGKHFTRHDDGTTTLEN